MKIGRKIYFEKATGNIILTTSEMCGSVIKTTIDQDFETFESLRGRVKDTVGVIQLEYGELSTEFNRCSGYKVDITKEFIDSSAIVFDYTPQVEEEIVREKTLEEKITTLEVENEQLKEKVSNTETQLEITNQAIAEITMMITPSE